MSDKLTDQSSEAQRRAEKIKAIRRSIHSEAEVAPMTYENKTTDSERSETIADRISNAKEMKNSTAEDILDELDAAIAFEKAEAARIAAEKEKARAKKAAAKEKEEQREAAREQRARERAEERQQQENDE